MANALNKVALKGLSDGTDGQVITYDANGNPVAVGPGTDGQVLTSTGAGSPPAFENLPASGAALTGSTNNTITTVTGANAIQGEANLTFDSGTLKVGGDSGNSLFNLNRTNAAGSNGNTFGNIIWSDNNANTVAQFRAVRDTAVDDAALVASTRPTGGSITERFRIDSVGRSTLTFVSDNSTVAEGLFINNTAANTGDNASIAFSTDSGGRKKSCIAHQDTGSYGRGDLIVSIDPDADSGSLDVNAHEKVRFQAAGGISFNGDSTQANALSDYEEGTWTPTFANLANASYNSNTNGEYIKIGKMVYIRCWIGLSSITGGQSWALTVGGFPFTSNSGSYGRYALAINANGLSFGSDRQAIYAAMGESGTTADIMSTDGTNPNAGTGYVTANNCTGSTSFYLCGSYHVLGY